MKALGSLLLAGVYAGASATSIHSTLTHSEYGLINWQRVGACGVPAKRPHSDIFDMLATRTTSGQNPKRKRTGNQNGNVSSGSSVVKKHYQTRGLGKSTFQYADAGTACSNATSAEVQSSTRAMSFLPPIVYQKPQLAT